MSQFSFDMHDPARAKRADAAFAEGMAHHEAGRAAEAETAYRKALQADPRHLDALHHLGILALQHDHPDAAIEIFGEAIKVNGRLPVIHSNMGLALQSMGRLEEAEAAFQRALAIQPGFAECWYNLGTCRLRQGRMDEARADLEHALSLSPGLAQAQVNLGTILQHEAKMDEALAAYDRAVALDPLLGEAWFSRAHCLSEMGRLDAAAACAERGVQVWPEYAPGFSGLGAAYMSQGRLDEAARAFDKALELFDDYADARTNQLLTLNYRTDLSPEAVRDAHRLWDRKHGAGVAPPVAPHANDRDPDRRLKIGYVSGDFRTHPVGYYFEGVLGAHDPKAVEVFCYSNNLYSDDDTTLRMKAKAANWRDLRGVSEVDAAEMVRRDGIDILVDLSGHTAHSRLRLMCCKPAPVQATWLGYPTTTGLSAIDYLVTDGVTMPAGWNGATEALVRLPHGRLCYRAPAYALEPAEPPCLVRGYPTFGSFNNLIKLRPEVIALWGELMRAVPEARLVLKWSAFGEESARERMKAIFAQEGVSADRLDIRGYVAHADMLAEYADIDIALDPFPFGGGVTSCEAMWMGVPVITLPGEFPASRQTLAFLHDIGLDELAAASKEDYLAKAVALAADTARLADLRKSLRPAMAASPLCDASAFTPSLEAAYRAMWRRWCAGETPAEIDVEVPSGRSA